MFTLLKSLTVPEVYLSEPISFVAALTIAELFYKFHSFLLEAGAFLVTWLVLGGIVRSCGRVVLARTPASVLGHRADAKHNRR